MPLAGLSAICWLEISEAIEFQLLWSILGMSESCGLQSWELPSHFRVSYWVTVRRVAVIRRTLAANSVRSFPPTWLDLDCARNETGERTLYGKAWSGIEQVGFSLTAFKS